MRLQFGDCIIDDDSRRLLHAGADVHLSPRAFDLLMTLIRERPRVMSKEALHAQLWPNTFVSDASLAMLVAEVRAALGETARQSGCVRTVHRRGYAFQASAVELLPAPAPSTDGEPGFWLVTDTSQVALLPGVNIIGRDPRSRVWLNLPGISRRHACIRIESNQATLQDFGSKNGTRARGGLVTAGTPLADGDALCFGSVQVTFRACSAEPTRTEADAK